MAAKTKKNSRKGTTKKSSNKSRKTATKSKAKSQSRSKKTEVTPADALGLRPSRDGKVQPVHVDATTARSDDDALVGQFAKVVSGKHQGRYGVFDTVAEFDKQDGYPKTVILVTRDEHAERIVVNYSDLRPSLAGGRV
jgi:hypothetical protein